MTTILSIGQYYLERHYGRGTAPRAAADAAGSGCGAASRSATRVEPPTSPPAHRGSAMSEPMVRAEEVHKRFGRLEVLKGISLEVAPRR